MIQKGGIEKGGILGSTLSMQSYVVNVTYSRLKMWISKERECMALNKQGDTTTETRIAFGNSHLAYE